MFFRGSAPSSPSLTEPCVLYTNRMHPDFISVWHLSSGKFGECTYHLLECALHYVSSDKQNTQCHPEVVCKFGYFSYIQLQKSPEACVLPARRANLASGVEPEVISPPPHSLNNRSYTALCWKGSCGRWGRRALAVTTWVPSPPRGRTLLGAPIFRVVPLP